MRYRESAGTSTDVPKLTEQTLRPRFYACRVEDPRVLSVSICRTPDGMPGAKTFVPLERVFFRVTSLGDAREFRVTVKDSGGARYHDERFVSDESAWTGSFLARGETGIHSVSVYAFGTETRDSTVTFTLEAETSFHTGDPGFDAFYSQIRTFMSKDVSEIQASGKTVRGYRAPDTEPIWIRDHTHQMKAFKYWERDIKSALEFFLENQRPDGSFYDLVGPGGTKHRVEVEADVEYLVVECWYQVWQATGDEQWARKWLSTLEAGLRYSMSHPDRWSPEFQLVKRALTIDTWDFAYNPSGRQAEMELDNGTPMGVMHGDNSGMYAACHIMAKSFDELGFPERGAYWHKRAEHFLKMTNQVCWNGRFYSHNVLIKGDDLKGIDQSPMLSLSNTYDINRGLADHTKAVSIIREYQSRREDLKEKYFAEWFSIHPCFPADTFGAPIGWGKREGEYVNGGIMPLVGGELARAAFAHGFEDYGLDILRRYIDLIYSTGETYLWYWPDGTPGKSSPATLPSDGWGASAMFAAFVEGLAGVRDTGQRFGRFAISPRWVCAGIDKAYVCTAYPASGAYLAYTFEHDPGEKMMTIQITSTGGDGTCHVLLPHNTEQGTVSGRGGKIDSELRYVEGSLYIDFELNVTDQYASITYST